MLPIFLSAYKCVYDILCTYSIFPTVWTRHDIGLLTRGNVTIASRLLLQDGKCTTLWQKDQRVSSRVWRQFFTRDELWLEGSEELIQSTMPTLVNFLEIWGWQRPSIFQNKHDPYDPHGPGSQLLNWWNVQHRLEWDLGGDVPTSPFCFAPTGSPGKAEWPWTQPSAMQWFINRLRMSRFLFNYPFPRSYRHSGMLV